MPAPRPHPPGVAFPVAEAIVMPLILLDASAGHYRPCKSHRGPGILGMSVQNGENAYLPLAPSKMPRTLEGDDE